MSIGSIGPLLLYTGDAAGAGGGIFSFSNIGNMYGTTSMSTSGSTGVIFTNYGSMSIGSIGPLLLYTGDAAGAGGGIFSFSNIGNMYGTTSMSTSGSTGVIFTNYGSMSIGSIGPLLLYTGDGAGSSNSKLVFFNSGTGSLTGDISLNASNGMGIAFQNNGTMSGKGPNGTALRLSGSGKLLAYNYGTISGTWALSGGSNDDLVYQGSTAATGAIVFAGGGGSDTLLNQGSASGIFFDATGSVLSTNINKLQNSHAAASTSDNSQPTITMIGGQGSNSLVNDVEGTGFAIKMFGGASPDSLYNAAANLPSIEFHSGGSPDRGTSTAPLGDALNNVGDGIGSISYFAPNDSSPNLLLNTGNQVGSIQMNAGFGFNLLSNQGSTVTNISLKGAQTVPGQGFPSVRYLTATAPNYGSTPANANILQNTGANVTGLTLIGGHGLTSFINNGSNVQNVSVTAGDGAATFYNSSTGTNLTNVQFTGGISSDSFRNDASGLNRFTLNMNGGGDVVDLRGASTGDQSNAATQSTVYLGDGGGTFSSIGADLKNVTIYGGSGNDQFQLQGSGATNIAIRGGYGTDTVIVASDRARGISVSALGSLNAGNFGANVSDITVTGGAGDTAFYNYGDMAAVISLIGGTGANLLYSLAPNVGTLSLTGGAGSNRIYAARSIIASIILNGGSGTNDLDIEGGSVNSISFTGGSNQDALRLNAQVTTNLFFDGKGGNNSIELPGQLNTPGLTTNITLGTNGNNVAILDGNVGSATAPVTIHGGSGNDRYLVMSTLTGNVVLSGGHGNNTYILADASASVTVDQTWQGVGDSSIATLDFSGFRNSGVNIDLSRTTPQTEGDLTLRLTDGLGITNVIGSQFADTIIGNGRNNNLQGAAYSQSGTTPPPTAAANARTQWVLVDFDSFTPSGTTLHVYTTAERQAILDRMNLFYRGSSDPNSVNPWYDIRFVQNPDTIPAGLKTSGQFITLFVNATPSTGQPGGESSAIDPGNESLSGWAVVQVNGGLGGAFQPASTSENFVGLTAKIGTHEVAHLLGLQHSDSVGPIGYGTHLTLYPGQPDPTSNVAPAAFETTDHVIGSPASIGSDRFSDLGPLYFGEREDIKLAIAFADPSVVITTKQAAPTSLAAPQNVPLASIAVKNTLSSDALNYGKTFLVSARQIDGHSTGGSDFYRFYATKGQLINADAASVVLNLSSNNTIDSTLILRDASGNIVATNYHGFETSDAQIVDYLVQQSGYFTIEVVSANATPGDYRLTISAFEAISNPAASNGADILKGGAGVDTFNGGPGVSYGMAMTGGIGDGATQAGTTFSRTVNFNDPGGYTWMATVDYGDGSGLVTLSASQIDAAGKTLSLCHVFTQTGSRTVKVTLTNDDGLTDTKSFTVNVTPSAATQFTVSAPSSSNAGSSFNYTVTAYDAYGNLATGYTGTVRVTSTDGQANLPASITLTNGTGTFSANLKTSGSQTLTATDTLSSSVSGRTNVTVVAGNAVRFGLSAPVTSVSGTTFSVTISALDAYGNVAIGYTGSVRVTNTDPQPSAISTSTFANGVGTFTANLKTAGNQTLTATDTTTSSINGNVVVSIQTGSIAYFAISQPTSSVTGNAFNVKVTAIDVYGNVVTGYSGLIRFSSSDGQAILPANSQLTNGTGTFSVTLKSTGNQTLTVTDTNTSSLTQSSTVSVLAANGSTNLISYSIQDGATQRSYIRYLDLYFDTNVGLPAFVGGAGIKLIRYDLNGLNPTVVSLSGLISVSGTRVRIDFGANGIGGNRLSNAGDGTYRLSLDLTGDGTFSTMIQFSRLYGDVNGDGVMDAKDVSLFQTYQLAGDLNGDINGDGFVDSRDKTAITLAQGRKIKLPL